MPKTIPHYPADSAAYPPPVDSPSQWTYRVSRQTLDNGETLYAIREFWRDNQGNLTSWSENEIAPIGSTLEELRWTLTKMLEALDKEVIDIGLPDNGKGQPPKYEQLINESIKTLEFIRSDVEIQALTDEQKVMIVKGFLTNLGESDE